MPKSNGSRMEWKSFQMEKGKILLNHPLMGWLHLQNIPRKCPGTQSNSGPCLVCLHFFQILGTFCCVNKPERAQNLIEFLATFWVNSANGLFTLAEILNHGRRGSRLAGYSFLPITRPVQIVDPMGILLKIKLVTPFKLPTQWECSK